MIEMHSNEYKEAWYWSSGSWDNHLYFEEIFPNFTFCAWNSNLACIVSIRLNLYTRVIH